MERQRGTVQRYLDRDISTIEMLYQLIDMDDAKLATEGLGSLALNVLRHLLDLTAPVPLKERSPQRNPRDYDRMEVVNAVVAQTIRDTYAGREFDFYSGFSGEPEYIITSDAMRIRAWAGYFDEVVRTLEPGPEGWVGIALAYHMCALDQDPRDGWLDPDPADTLRQLEQAADRLPIGRARDFRDAYLELLRAALRTRSAVYVREE
jgi:hypothetical protein